MTQPTEYEQAFLPNPDGGQVGKTSTDPIGFYGTTPAVMNATSSGAMTTTIGAVLGTQTAVSSSAFGASTAAIMTSTFAQVNALQVDMASLQALLNNVRTTMVNLGMMKGS